MSKSASAKFRERLLALSDDPEALINAAMEEYEARIKAENKLREVENGQDALSREYHRMKTERDAARQEVSKLQKVLADITAQLDARKRDCFGRSSETSDALAGIASDNNEDPLSEDAAADPNSTVNNPPALPRNFEEAANLLSGNQSGSKGNPTETGDRRPRKPRGSRKKALDKYPHRYNFDFSIELLDALYGAGNWRTIGFRMTETIEHIHEVHYVEVVYRPVVKLQSGRIIAPDMPKFYPHSYLSASLLADLLTKKFDLYLPVYRILNNTGLGGLGIDDTTFYNWINGFAMDFLKPVYEHLVCLMLAVPYHQCDETFWTVIRDGRKAGSKSFMWVHVLSELYDGPRIIIVEYEKTRGADHLREFYRLFKGNIGCDAFSAYPVLEKEHPGLITISGCMMHVRRRFYFALLLQWKSINSEDIAVNCLEAQVIIMIQDIYHAETPLKGLPADERLKRRQTEVHPLVEKFYDFVRGIDLSDPSLTAIMRDAVSYALNHEREVCSFLEDGNIAMDNGYCERAIKPLALLRRNSLFSTSIKGAEATAISTSIVETVRANRGIPYFFFKYVFEELPKHLNDPNKDWLDDFVPWSDKYKAYEAAEEMKLPDFEFADLPYGPWEILKQLMEERACA